jgi:large subunit ribosomal protein L29
MKKEEIKALNNQELADKLAEETSSIAKMKINHAVSPIENPMKIRFSRKTIARLKTELSIRNKSSN